MAAEVPGKVERNLRDRAGAVKTSVGREIQIARTFVRDLVGLRPVKAVVDVTTETLDNVGDLVKSQAEITRRWASA